MANNANEVKFTKNVTTKVVGTNNAVALTDEIFKGLSSANQLLVVIAETYTTVVPTVIKYASGYGLSRESVDAIGAAMQL